MAEKKKKNILFLCTGNSCRSQMAEGWFRYFHDKEFTIYSAGIEKHGLNPNAVQVMKEDGVDIQHHYSKTVKELFEKNANLTLDLVITVCGHAAERCPMFPGNAVIIHQGFDDPPKLAEKFKDQEDILNCYRKVRDQIKDYAKQFKFQQE